MNGKDFFGGDVKTATRELPANIIDKVQVIDDYGDQATVSGIKDGDPEKIINLQIKKDKNKGFFGRVTVGAGTQDRYQHPSMPIILITNNRSPCWAAVTTMASLFSILAMAMPTGHGQHDENGAKHDE